MTDPRTIRTNSKLPPAPKLLVGREDDLRELKTRLDTSTAGAHIQVLTAMRGWPGVGKTTLASAAAYDPDIAAMFPDGVLWASLGKTPSVYAELGAWCRALGLPELGTARSVEELSAQLRAVLRDKRFLLIVDDVWQAGDVEPFRVGGPGCATLITTRLTEVAREVAPTAESMFVLEVLSPEKALELLRLLAPLVVAEHPDVCQELVNDLERLPLAVQVAGRMLHSRRSMGLSVVTLLADIRAGAKLIAAKPPPDRPEVANDTSPTVAALLQKSTDLLTPPERECFARLGVFAPKPATFAIAAMQHMWEVENAEPTVERLVNYGLLEPQVTGRFWLHALLKVHARTLIDG